jgi:4-amino-4-deoxy-L-arabinose transferase-like glycosyltransferase
MSTETTGTTETNTIPPAAQSPFPLAGPHHDGIPNPTTRPSDDPPWVRPALVGLLVGTALLYLWGLGASGWANSFYAAAAQAGSQSWEAFFFGSSDAAGSITVDKSPLALWPMALSVRLFGLSSWSLLVPQAVMGVGSVALLYATVRRTMGSPGGGLLAGATLALTPVAVLIFRFDNPDALLVLLLVGSAASTLRAVDATKARAAGLTGHPIRWIALGGALVGLAFLAKMLQAFLVLPALLLVYLVAADTSLGKRVGHLLVAFAAMVAAAGWWVAIVSLWPADSRPYIGGSQHNSILELTLGYNGLGRLTGNEVGSVGGAANAAARWGNTGILRMFDSESGGQIAWLLPAAVILLCAGLWFTRRARRTDLARAGLLVWGGWLVVTALTFSFMAGIFHAYYTVALAPAIAALVGIGATVLWRRRESYSAALVMAATVSLTTGLAVVLLDRTPDYLPWLRWGVAVLGFSSALMLAAVRHLPRLVAAVVAGTAVVAVLTAPAAYSLTTAGTPHTGSIPSAGPPLGSSAGHPAGPPLGPSAGPSGGPGAAFGPRSVAGRPGGVGTGAAAGTGIPGGTGASTGGLLEGSSSTSAIDALLRQDASSYRWAAAAVGSNTAAGYQLSSEEPVMAIGGFNGSDPSPTLAQFEQYVADGDVHWFIASGGGGRGGPMGPGGESMSSIASWVEQNFTATTVDGVTLYDLSGGAR